MGAWNCRSTGSLRAGYCPEPLASWNRTIKLFLYSTLSVLFTPSFSFSYNGPVFPIAIFLSFKKQYLLYLFLIKQSHLSNLPQIMLNQKYYMYIN